MGHCVATAGPHLTLQRYISS